MMKNFFNFRPTQINCGTKQNGFRPQKKPWPIKLRKENKSNNKDKSVTVSAMKAYGEARGIVPRILYLRTNWRRVAFTLLKGAVPNVTLRLRN
jgi:hypothetical protein